LVSGIHIRPASKKARRLRLLRIFMIGETRPYSTCLSTALYGHLNRSVVSARFSALIAGQVSFFFLNV